MLALGKSGEGAYSRDAIRPALQKRAGSGFETSGCAISVLSLAA